MRASALSAILLLAASHAAALAISRRADIQCPPTDKNGGALTATGPAEDEPGFITCTYQGGAGLCTYFPADGSFSSGGSTCPKGIAQDPSVTTDTSSIVGAATPPPVSAPPRKYFDDEDDDDDTSSDDYDEPDTYQYGNAKKATTPTSPKDTRRVRGDAYSDEEDDPYDDDMGGGLTRFESASAQPPRMVRSNSSSSEEEEEDDGPVTPPQLPADVDLRELISGEKDVELEGLYESVRGCACHGHREEGGSVEGMWDVPVEKSPEGRRLAVVAVGG